MGQELCSNCGHPLPNAVGADLYCTECGEPVAPPRPRSRADLRPDDQGEQHTFAHPAWQSVTLEQLTTIVGDLTGYRATFVRECVTAGMQRSRLKVVELGGAMQRQDLDLGALPLRFLIAERSRRQDELAALGMDDPNG